MNPNLPSGQQMYDSDGNYVYDPTNNYHYLYDAQGHICAAHTSGGIFGYIYDADGTRVAKGTLQTMSCDPTTNGFSAMTLYVIGPDGQTEGPDTYFLSQSTLPSTASHPPKLDTKHPPKTPHHPIPPASHP